MNYIDNASGRVSIRLDSGLSFTTDLGFSSITQQSNGVHITQPGGERDIILPAPADYVINGILKPNLFASDLVTYLSFDAVGEAKLKERVVMDDRLVYVGDSITAAQFLVNGISNYYMSNGFATYANILSGHRLYQPAGGNKGISGNTTVDVIARLGAILELRPKVAVVLIGVNDIRTGIPIYTTLANLNIIYKALKSIGAKIIALTQYAPAGGNAFTSSQDAARLVLNTFIKNSQDVTSVVDTSLYVTPTMLEDGLHPNVFGAYAIGSDLSKKILLLAPNYSAGYQIFPEGITNYSFTGTTGSKTNGATGVVATGWTLDASGMGGGSLAGAKTADNNLSQQMMTISGNYTGNSRNATLKQDFTNTLFSQNDTIEAIADFEIVSLGANIKSIKVGFSVFTAGYASNIHYAESHYGQSLDTYPLLVGRYTIKTPALKITGGIPAIIQYLFIVEFRDVVISTPISTVIKINQIGPRRTSAL